MTSVFVQKKNLLFLHLVAGVWTSVVEVHHRLVIPGDPAVSYPDYASIVPTWAVMIFNLLLPSFIFAAYFVCTIFLELLFFFFFPLFSTIIAIIHSFCCSGDFDQSTMFIMHSSPFFKLLVLRSLWPTRTKLMQADHGRTGMQLERASLWTCGYLSRMKSWRE